MCLIIVYVIGVIVAWVIIKRGRNIENENDWEDVFSTFIGSFLWFIYIPLAIIIVLYRRVFGNQPPKWL